MPDTIQRHITALWSTDPSFYELITGDSDIVGEIFVKINYTDANVIINKFGLREILPGTYGSSDGDHKYLCVTSQDQEEAMELITSMAKSI